MRRLLLAGVCVLATAMPALSQTLRIALRQDLDVLDPTTATTYVGRIVFAGLCDKLFDIDEKLNIVPQLATGYEWADDRTLVIHLRSGVKFHDGEALDAAAVKYSLERHLNMQGSFRKSEISSIDHVEVADPATVRVVLKSPSGAFLAQLTDRSGMVYPPKATEAAGKDFPSTRCAAGRSNSSSACRRTMSRWSVFPSTGMPRTSISTRWSIRCFWIHRCGWPI